MIRNSLAVAIILYGVLAAVVLKECIFFAPLRGLIWQQYGRAIVGFSILVILNIFAAAYALLRKLALEDTGDKLTHLEKQLRSRETMSEELTERILDRK
jgi:hypothetical protein